MIADTQVRLAPRGAMLPEQGQILTGPQFSEPVRVETTSADTKSLNTCASLRVSLDGRASTNCPSRPGSTNDRFLILTALTRIAS
jgi:hypothetical protein